MGSHRGVFVAAVVAVLASGGVGRAEPPCLADIQKFCSDVGVGAGRIQACLKAHEAELSPRCKPDVDRLRKKAGDLAAVCVFDIQRFCIIEGPGGEGVGPGGGAIATCLQQHLDDLSPECKAKFK